MIAIVTGNMVNAGTVETGDWMPELKRFLNTMGKSPKVWEIFRGDSFQFMSEPKDAFLNSIILKSIVRKFPGMDARVSIGIGTIDFQSTRITESNGSAFIRSGKAFDSMKQKEYLTFTTGVSEWDRTFNLFARFVSQIIDNWSTATAETVQVILENPTLNQQQVAEKLKINQSAVSQNRKRAQLDLIMDFNAYYNTAVSSLTT